MVADLPSAPPAHRRTLVPASPVARVAIAVALVVPMVVAAIAVLAAFASAWIVWAMIAWFMFGHRRHGYYRHSRRGYGPQHAQRQAGVGPGRSFWT